jgi:hypothetical protein
VQKEAGVFHMRVEIEMIDAIGVDQRGPPLDAMHRLVSSSSARYAPSWPVMPVTSATFLVINSNPTLKRKKPHTLQFTGPKRVIFNRRAFLR